ncbi:MAG: ribonuclease HIII [Candidatus Cloacimonetes bacterium]|nr:ribonuclease HIII [Candidatus Cloacimonadota bacterium]
MYLTKSDTENSCTFRNIKGDFVHKTISIYLETLLPRLANRGIDVIDEREISYGIQLILKKAGDTSNLNIYYSERKHHISKILGGVSTTALFKELVSLLYETPANTTSDQLDFHQWKCWIGSDESGKGDYLGSLSVAAFCMDQSLRDSLSELGVCDSKLLKDNQIRRIAHILYQKYPSRISSIVLKPLKYNEIYASMQTEKKNLNDLLAWQHSKAIQELTKSHPQTDGIVIDKFSRAMKAKSALERLGITLPIIEREHAESDLAVAAASIIARYNFLLMHERMCKHYSLTFPLGASAQSRKAAQRFIEKYGFKRLGEVAKLHFATTKILAQGTIDEV